MKPFPGNAAQELASAFKSLPAPVVNTTVELPPEEPEPPRQVVFERNPNGTIKSATIEDAAT